MIAEADIKKMTVAERLEAINMLWDSLDEIPEDEIQSPAWHAKVLAERTREMEAGEATFITLEELTRRFDNLRDERANRQP